MNAQDETRKELSVFKGATGPPERSTGRLKYVEAPMQTLATKRSETSKVFFRDMYAKGSTMSILTTNKVILLILISESGKYITYSASRYNLIIKLVV